MVGGVAARGLTAGRGVDGVCTDEVAGTVAEDLAIDGGIARVAVVGGEEVGDFDGEIVSRGE